MAEYSLRLFYLSGRPQEGIPWYEANLFWAPFGIGLTLVFAAMAAANLRWLLLLSGLCFVLTMWRVVSPRGLLLKVVVMSVWVTFVFTVLMRISIKLRSASETPVTNKPGLEVKPQPTAQAPTKESSPIAATPATVEPKSVLTFSAFATNMSVPAVEEYGIKWKDGWRDERLTIKNPTVSPLDNVDLLVDGKRDRNTADVVQGVGQITDLPDVLISAVRAVFPPMPFRLHGNDSGKDTVQMFTFEPHETASGMFPPTSEWRVYCRRLSDETEMRLILATQPRVSLYHVHGSYELPASQTSKLVNVDVWVDVAHAHD